MSLLNNPELVQRIRDAANGTPNQQHVERIIERFHISSTDGPSAIDYSRNLILINKNEAGDRLVNVVVHEANHFWDYRQLGIEVLRTLKQGDLTLAESALIHSEARAILAEMLLDSSGMKADFSYGIKKADGEKMKSEALKLFPDPKSAAYKAELLRRIVERLYADPNQRRDFSARVERARQEYLEKGWIEDITKPRVLPYDDPRSISAETQRHFNRARAHRSPIILDLDGDGVEIIQLGAGAPLFDHDGDGVRSLSAWAAPHDALLVRDLDSNGLIDSGQELFGDNTKLADGSRAADGYHALAALDANKDGQITTTDPAFAELRVWRDQNSNGVSETGELLSFAELGITSIGVAKTDQTVQLPDGTYLDGTGSFEIAGQQHAFTDAWFAVDSFTGGFDQEVALTEKTTGLPEMSGSGAVRSLLQACETSPELLEITKQFALARTRDEQLALMGPLLSLWAATTPMVTTEKWAAQGHKVVYNFYAAEPGGPLDIYPIKSGADLAAWKAKLSVLEAFNGATFAEFGTSEGMGGSKPTLDGSTEVWTRWGRQLELEQAYNALFDSVYSKLALQTRLNGYVECLIQSYSVLEQDTAANDLLLYLKEQYSLDARRATLDLGAVRVS